MNVAVIPLSIVGAGLGAFAGYKIAKRKKRPAEDTVLFTSLIGGALGALVVGSFSGNGTFFK